MMHRDFWDAGLRVFGIHGADKHGNCECGWSECPPASLHKHPRSSGWQHTPLWSEEQIEAMEESEQFAAGYGVLCNGLIVVDVDARNGGVESFAKLAEAVPEVTGAGLIVKTGSGNGSKHYYFKAPEGAALVSHHPDYPGLDFKSSGYVVGPGSMHRSGDRYEAVYGSPDDIDDAPAGLIDLLRKPERHRSEYDGMAIDVSHADIVEMLAHVSADSDYEVWIRIGMAVHEATGGTGFAIWDEWSRQGEKYPGRQSLDSHWHSFGRSSNPVTIGTLIHYAEQGGWKMPVGFAPEVEAIEQWSAPDTDRADGLPFDISGVDLRKPPGFVGEVARWMEAQSRRPRETIAVAAALCGLGNVAGLRYTDDKDGVTTNLFAFCVAGSRTGKESIQQAQAEVHRVAGLAPATHGMIKSEQEITRNLIRHQASLYIIDEVGGYLEKIKNAQSKGGAPYLDGIISTLMASYSKAAGFMLLTGDAKEDLRAVLLKESAQIEKRIEANEGKLGDEQRAEDIKRALGNLDHGLERPFVSMVGYTTPVTFDQLVDFRSATDGFIGRSLIFNERETAPRSKRNFKRTPMPEKMANQLKVIFMNGEYDMTAQRVEFYGERKAIPTAPAASDMLNSCVDWFEDMAEEHKGRTGLESLYLGAYELVSKVSLILAIPSGLRTTEHVRWAFALVRKDIDDKARMVIANDRQKDDPKIAMASRIANIIDGDGETLAVICNRMRQYRRADIEKVLADMVERGIVQSTATKSGRSLVYTLC